MRLAVCDDNPAVLRSFEQITGGLHNGESIGISLFSAADELLDACRETSFNMIFIDIMLGEANGIEVAARAADILPDTKIVFITAHVLDFAEKIFTGVRPYGYIGKPFEPSKAEYYINRLREEMDEASRVLCVNRRGVPYRLALSGIHHIESGGRQAFVHFGDEIIDIYEKLDELMERLDDRFVRCHQSFIVNLEHVTGMDADGFLMAGQGVSGRETIRISRNRIKDARERYFEYKGRSLI